MGKKKKYHDSVVGRLERALCFVIGMILLVFGVAGLSWLLVGGLVLCSPGCDLSVWRLLGFGTMFTAIAVGGLGNVVYAFVPRHPAVPWKSVKWAQHKHRPTVYGVKVVAYYLGLRPGRS